MAIRDTATETAAEVNIYKHIISSKRIGSLLFALRDLLRNPTC